MDTTTCSGTRPRTRSTRSVPKAWLSLVRSRSKPCACSTSAEVLRLSHCPISFLICGAPETTRDRNPCLDTLQCFRGRDACPRLGHLSSWFSDLEREAGAGMERLLDRARGNICGVAGIVARKNRCAGVLNRLCD